MLSNLAQRLTNLWLTRREEWKWAEKQQSMFVAKLQITRMVCGEMLFVLQDKKESRQEDSTYMMFHFDKRIIGLCLGWRPLAVIALTDRPYPWESQSHVLRQISPQQLVISNMRLGTDAKKIPTPINDIFQRSMFNNLANLPVTTRDVYQFRPR